MHDNLLSIEKFIEAARKQGAAFGDGDPKIHLAYLTKLGILPPAVKRKIAGELTGCYDSRHINSVLRVEQMKNKGMTYSQIAKTINLQSGLVVGQNNNGMVFEESNLGSLQRNSLTAQGYELVKNPSFLYLIIGVLLGFLLSTLNSQGFAQMQKQVALADTQSAVKTDSTSQQPGSVYVISVPKQNLDKLDKTNINYLIQN